MSQKSIASYIDNDLLGVSEFMEEITKVLSISPSVSFADSSLVRGSHLFYLIYLGAQF